MVTIVKIQSPTLVAACISVILSIHLIADIEINIKFPTNYQSQGIKVYQAGEILHTEVFENTVSFFMKNNNSKDKKFYLLVVRPSDISYVFTDSTHHTIQYRTVLENKLYKLFELSLSAKGEWVIKPMPLGQDRAIPDQAIIVLYNPLYVDQFPTPTNSTIPTIYLVSDLLEKSGGVESLFYEEIRYLLDTLHMDPLHQKVSYRVTLGNNRCKQIIGI